MQLKEYPFMLLKLFPITTQHVTYCNPCFYRSRCKFTFLDSIKQSQKVKI